MRLIGELVRGIWLRDVFEEAIRLFDKHSGFYVGVYYHQSDEISLLFSYANRKFLKRKVEKWVSVIASEFTKYFNFALRKQGEFQCDDVDGLATFDSRLVCLPKCDDAVDYFDWRQEDARRNCISSYAYWALRKMGHGGNEAHEVMLGMRRDRKMVLATEGLGVDWEDVKDGGLSWQYHG
ncbi:hypothetical protein JD969_10300 [Planctomycetota bacterium]|nr:hypothetical protein JD969_10300 [Planctomycetota bacterium]